jgi:hypothetical protein
MWIKLEHDLLLNLDHIISVYPNDIENKNFCDYVIDYFEPGEKRPFRESFASKEERDRRYEFIKTMLIFKMDQ